MPLACIFKSNLFIGLTTGKNIAQVNVEENYERTSVRWRLLRHRRQVKPYSSIADRYIT